jgi:hypothetical protein
MPVPALQVSFQASAMNAPDGWAVDNGKLYGARTNTGYTTSLSSYGWNCDVQLTTEDRSSEDGTNYRSTVVKPDTGICNLGTILPEWRVTVPNGFYQVDTLYSKPFSTHRGCKIQDVPNFDADHASLGNSDVDWVSRLVNTTNGKISLTGGTNSQCGAYAAVVIYPKDTVQSDTYCQGLPGMCCPLFIDMENRPCSRFDAPCKL